MHAVTIAKALADETRFRLLMALRDGELCVCQLVALVDLSNATVSKHLTVLKNAGLVEARKDGRWMYYKIPHAPDEVVRDAIDWSFREWRHSARAKSDARTLKQVCCKTPEEICRINKKNQRQ